jgi:DNA-binding response OmpR family regulator
MDGLDVARALRHDSEVPIIMVTARVEESDRLRGLEIGADDYLTKPFSPRELVARVRAVLRRTAVGHDVRDRIRLGDLSIDLPRMTVTRGRQPVDVTATEFQILAAMARQPGRVFTRAQLLDAVQADGGEAFDRAIDAHIKNIRRKLEPDPRSPRYLLTVYGVGYKCADL